MARVTAEDCLTKIDSRFDLIVLASKRAHVLAKSGETSLVPEENDKVTVLALREIAAGMIDISYLEERKKKVNFEEALDRAKTDFASMLSNHEKQEDMEEIKLATTQTAAEEISAEEE